MKVTEDNSGDEFRITIIEDFKSPTEIICIEVQTSAARDESIYISIIKQDTDYYSGNVYLTLEEAETFAYAILAEVKNTRADLT